MTNTITGGGDIAATNVSSLFRCVRGRTITSSKYDCILELSPKKRGVRLKLSFFIS